MCNKSKVVFSTDPDYQDQKEKTEEMVLNKEQQLRVWRQRIGGGKIITIVKGFYGKNEDLQSLWKQLKTVCNAGGTTKNGEVLIQGDHRDKIVNLLNNKGYQAKASGG